MLIWVGCSAGLQTIDTTRIEGSSILFCLVKYFSYWMQRKVTTNKGRFFFFLFPRYMVFSNALRAAPTRHHSHAQSGDLNSWPWMEVFTLRAVLSLPLPFSQTVLSHSKAYYFPVFFFFFPCDFFESVLGQSSSTRKNKYDNENLPDQANGRRNTDKLI